MPLESVIIGQAESCGHDVVCDGDSGKCQFVVNDVIDWEAK